MTTKAISEQAVHLQLAKDVAAREAAQGINATSHDLHTSVMIANGLVIKEDQQKLAADTVELSLHPTEKLLSGLLE
ncbi:hypothetical protein H0H87_009693 [Tephrocybe sp. NHM501043]|nr:hypothetical protein H0H87_009693 [Tephrocybe sp. NHM501043]